jgi:uracil-DNA glycosylase
LVSFREVHAAAEPSWFNGAVPSFGNPDEARLLIVGLAPGIQGANKTGRPFTGDYAGDLLYSTLLEFGFARGTYGAHAGDGLELVDTMITNAVRCVPPANKPTSAEINTCRPFLLGRIQSLGKLQAIVALGRVAHDSILTAFKLRKVTNKFAHGARHDLGNGIFLYDSYHCSRYNTNTRVLTTEMFHDIFRELRAEIK